MRVTSMYAMQEGSTEPAMREVLGCTAGGKSSSEAVIDDKSGNNNVHRKWYSRELRARIEE